MKTEKEIWKTYPEFPFIQGSNLKRIRVIDHYVIDKIGRKQPVKGHVLPQHRTKSGYMLVHFGANGRVITRSAHRIIASCFLPNPKNLPQVNHKNGIRDDNVPSNLEWCTASYNCQYREKYGVSMTEAQGHRLYAVNLKTHEVLYFRSQSEAGRALGINSSHIGSVVGGERNYVGEYWFTEDKTKITKEKLYEIKASMQKGKALIAINLKTHEVSRFESQHEAERRLEAHVQSIARVVDGRQKTARGHWFTKADNNAIESTKTKFGVEVANKVGKLLEMAKQSHSA